MKTKIGVLIHGNGSNLQAILDACADGRINGEVVWVGCDKAGAYGLVRAAKAGVPTTILPYMNTRIAFERDGVDNETIMKAMAIQDKLPANHCLQAKTPLEIAVRMAMEDIIIAECEQRGVELLLGAGFMYLFTPHLIDHFQLKFGGFRIMNIHPAILPSFPGMYCYEDAFNYGVEVHGATVFFVDYGEDTGAIIGQSHYERLPDDTLGTFSERGLELEWRLYVRCVQLFCLGLLEIMKSESGRYIVKKLPGSENIRL